MNKKWAKYGRGKPSPRSRPSRGMSLPRTCSGATPSSGDTPQRPDCKNKRPPSASDYENE